MAQSKGFGDSIAKLLESYPRHLEFPLGDKTPIPTDTERAVLSVIEKDMPLSKETIVAVRETLGIRDAYAVATFSVRTAILAARTHTPELLVVSAFCLMIDDCRVDWRDVLVALSIIEASAKDVEANFEKSILTAVEVATQDRKKIVVEDYLSRTEQMRDVEVMGFTRCGRGENLSFMRIE